MKIIPALTIGVFAFSCQFSSADEESGRTEPGVKLSELEGPYKPGSAIEESIAETDYNKGLLLELYRDSDGKTKGRVEQFHEISSHKPSWDQLKHLNGFVIAFNEYISIMGHDAVTIPNGEQRYPEPILVWQ